MTHRIGSHSDDWGGDSDLPCDCDTRKKTTTPNNSIRDITDEEEPFGGLVINHYGIYNKADQKALNAYILGEVMELIGDDLPTDMFGSWTRREDGTMILLSDEVIITNNLKAELRNKAIKKWGK